MRDFLTNWFTGSPLLWGPIVALVLFGAIFTLVAIRVYRRDAASYDELARLPLEDCDE